MDKPKKNLSMVQKIIRKSSCGRNIITPKHLLTTSSSDEAPRKRNLSSGLSMSVLSKIKELEGTLDGIKNHKVAPKSSPKPSTSKSTSMLRLVPKPAKDSYNSKPSSSVTPMSENSRPQFTSDEAPGRNSPTFTGNTIADQQFMEEGLFEQLPNSEIHRNPPMHGLGVDHEFIIAL